MLRRPLAATLAVAGLVAWLIGLAALTMIPAGAEDGPGGQTPSSGSTSGSTSDGVVPATDATSDSTDATDAISDSTDATSDSTDATTDATDATTDATEPTSDSTDATEAPDTTEKLTNAVLRWGINNESNTATFSGFNFLVAGKIPDPGRGGIELASSDWLQRAGNVAVEKYNAATGAWAPATWTGLRTDASGADLRAGVSSNHELVFSKGTGHLDRTTGKARIVWDGDATVIYYSGASFFYLSDPVLEIEEGRGTVTATLGGYGSDQSDMTLWVDLPDTDVTVATLSDVQLSDPDGFIITPDYSGVPVQTSGSPQVRTEAGWGAFPQTWVTFMEKVGTASYWYSSGGPSDANKSPLPLTIAYDAERPVTPTPNATPTKVPKVTNTAPAPPATAAPVVAAPAVPAPPVAAPPALGAPDAEHIWLGAVSTASSPVTPAAGNGDTASVRSWPWWAGGGLLSLAAATLLLPTPRRTP